MRVFTEKQFEKSWSFFWNEMTKVNLNAFFDEESLKEKLKTAACAISEDTGVAFPGGLITHINATIVIADKLYDIVSNTPFDVLKIDYNSLKKVLLLMHLSKIEMFEPNDNAWEIEKRGFNYKFTELSGRLKFGERSILLANNKGITLTADEFEAIRCLDREGENSGTKMFDSPISMIVRQANEIAYAYERERNK